MLFTFLRFCGTIIYVYPNLDNTFGNEIRKWQIGTN